LSCKNCRKPLGQIENKDEKCIECGREIVHYNKELNFWDKIKIKINTWRNRNEG
tara:strand:+ start:1467 stop:1628 length:162 start_codon:yes stop_codon:yes gene_type:complete